MGVYNCVLDISEFIFIYMYIYTFIYLHVYIYMYMFIYIYLYNSLDVRPNGVSGSLLDGPMVEGSYLILGTPAAQKLGVDE